MQSYDIVSPCPLQTKDTRAAQLTPQKHHQVSALQEPVGQAGWGEAPGWQSAALRHKVPLACLLPISEVGS